MNGIVDVNSMQISTVRHLSQKTSPFYVILRYIWKAQFLTKVPMQIGRKFALNGRPREMRLKQ